MENARVRVYWLPLGAGGRVVARNGRLFEAWVARREHRSPCDLYHAALEVEVGSAAYVIEMAPAWSRVAEDRGVVATGPVGLRWLGRSALFRYEVRRWRDGEIPDIGEAVASPRLLSTDGAQARRLLELVPLVPTPVWGRDELGAGDMWNSNSLISWLIARSGIHAESIPPPPGGRAPGWTAGLVVARRR